MKKSHYNHYVFYKWSNSSCILLVVYIDDIVIIGNDWVDILKLKIFLQTKFQIKDLEALWYFLDIEIAQSKKGIFLSQRKYVFDFLNEVRLLGIESCDTFMTPHFKLELEDGKLPKDLKWYRRLVGKIELSYYH